MNRYIFYLFIFLSLFMTSCYDDIKYEIIGEGESTVTAIVKFHPLITSNVQDAESRTPGNTIRGIKNFQIFIYTANNSELYRTEVFRDGEFEITENTKMPSGIDDTYQSEEKTDQTEVKLKSPLPFGRYKIYVVANFLDDKGNFRVITEEEAKTPLDLKKIKSKWNVDNISDNAQMFGCFADDDQSEYTDAPIVVVNKLKVSLNAWIKRLASKLTIVYDGTGLHEGINIYIRSVSIRDIPKECYLGFDESMLTETQIKDKVNGNSPNSTDELIDKPKNGTLYYKTVFQSTASDEVDQVETLSEDPNISIDDYKDLLNINKSVKALGAVSVGEDHKYEYVDGKPKTHQENMEALFFYENCQGNYADFQDKKFYDKTPYSNDVGKPQDYKVGDNPENLPGDFEDNIPVYKDNVPYGTYIEVDGYYDSSNPATQTTGPKPIKYRFMLGQDVTYNYNALRNRHYKLTLSFRGYANQPEWHIIYDEEEPGLYPLDEYYVSYLYNTRHDMPIRLTGNPYKVTLQIIENNWAPYKANNTPDEYDDVVPAQVDIPGQLSFRWFKELYEQTIASRGTATSDVNSTSTETPSPYGGYTVKPLDGPNGTQCYYGLHDIDLYTNSQDGAIPLIQYSPALPTQYSKSRLTPIWVGFLALQVPTHYDDYGTIIPTGIQASPTSDQYRQANTIKGMLNYYTGKGGTDTQNNSGNVKMYECTYDFSAGLPDANQTFEVLSNNGGSPTGRNAATLKNNGDDSFTLTAPLFTMPKEIGFISGFSGTNPYEMYERRAKVLITAYYHTESGNKKIIKDVPVFQTQRVVNPKGVWRTGDSQQPFRVKLMYLKDNSSSTKFQQIESDGEWTAWVATPLKEDFPRSGASIYLTGANGIGDDGKLHGSTGSFIDFTINFAETTTSTNCEKVIVRYHGNNCQHTILVRQGYNQTVALQTGGSEWSSFCVYAFRGDLDRIKPTESNPTTASQMPISGNTTRFDVTIPGLTAEMTINPLALGTMYKRGNYSEGIRILNNKTYLPLQMIGSDGKGPLALVSLKKNGNIIERVSDDISTWPDIYGIVTNTEGAKWRWSGFSGTVYGNDVEEGGNDYEYDLPSFDDFKALSDMELGAGVVYANGIGEVQETADDPEIAYGFFNDGNHADMMTSKSGMRGVIVYNNENYNQIFFPMGYSGIGRRTVQFMPNNNKAYDGYLRYGALPDVLNFHSNGGTTYYNQYRPVSYNLPSAPGAIYWLKESTQNGTKNEYFSAIDFNYNDLNFSAYTGSTGVDNGDALIIKPIVKHKRTNTRSQIRSNKSR